MPIEISTPADLDNMRSDLSGDYVLVNDIDMSGWGDWTPIGDESNPFSGILNGNGYTIKNLSVINPNPDTSVYDYGLFGYLDWATIEQLNLENVVVQTGRGNNVGCLAGSAYDTTIRKVQSLNCQVDGIYYVGGLIGRLEDCTLEKLYCSGTITANYYEIVEGFPGDDDSFGGIAGRLTYSSVYQAAAIVTIDLQIGTSYIGGLFGYGLHSGTLDYEVLNCYAQVEVLNSSSGSYLGGLIGSNDSLTEIKNCYAYSNIGTDGSHAPVLAVNTGDTPLTAVFGISPGVTSATYGIMITETEGKTKETYTPDGPYNADWNFADIWMIDQGSSYPYLQWKIEKPEPNCTMTRLVIGVQL